MPEAKHNPNNVELNFFLFFCCCSCAQLFFLELYYLFYREVGNSKNKRNSKSENYEANLSLNRMSSLFVNIIT